MNLVENNIPAFLIKIVTIILNRFLKFTNRILMFFRSICILMLKKILTDWDVNALDFFSVSSRPTSSTKSRLVLLAPASRAPGNYRVPVKCRHGVACAAICEQEYWIVIGGARDVFIWMKTIERSQVWPRKLFDNLSTCRLHKCTH